MKVSFRSVAILTALIFFALALIWMLKPDFVLSDWGVEFTASVGLIGRRAAALYAGIAVMFWSARNAEPSPARSALLKGAVVACWMLAALGIVELEAGHVNSSILVAVSLEVILSLALLYVGLARSAQSHVPTGKQGRLIKKQRR